ncbi:hypothetical protein PAMA_020122 [Pampus argenteus]
MVLTEEGDMIYLTENVNRHVGITQLDLLGQSVYDFVHPCDQEELRDLLTPRPGSSKKPLTDQASERNFFLRMKSTLTSRGRTVLHCTGHIRPFGGSSAPPADRVMTLLCEPVPHPSSVEFPLDTCTFLTRHSMDLRFTHCEGRVTELLGYKPDNLIGRSAFEFHHALDSDHVSTSHYRFLANSGGFVWAETQATVLYNNKTSQPEAVVCLNFILSAVEQPDVVFCVEQIRCGKLPKTEVESPAAAAEDDGRSDVCDPDSEGQSEELLQSTPEAENAIVPPTGDFVELSFACPLSPSSASQQPQDLCTPQLLQLLSPIFNPVTPPSSSSSQCLRFNVCRLLCEKEEEEVVMDTGKVEQFFAVWPDDGEKDEGQMLEYVEEMDLDMLAPYISMDDDFQLTFLSSLSEETNRPPSSSEPSALTSAVSVNRKRTHNPDDEKLMIQDKRQKQDPSSIEEELLLSHRLLGCLEETDQSDLLLDPCPGRRSQLLTDRDPVLGGVHGLCDTAVEVTASDYLMLIVINDSCRHSDIIDFSTRKHQKEENVGQCE